MFANHLGYRIYLGLNYYLLLILTCVVAKILQGTVLQKKSCFNRVNKIKI